MTDRYSQTRRLVTLPNGRTVSLGEYVRSWRTLKATAPETSVRGFDHFPERADRILRELRRGMHDRINAHIPGFGQGRKWDHNWQRAARHCANEVNRLRLIVRWVPPDFKARLAHRIHRED